MVTRGRIERVEGECLRASGLDGVAPGERVEGPEGALAVVAGLERTLTVLHLLRGRMAPGDEVSALASVTGYVTASSLLGRVVDPLGGALDGGCSVGVLAAPSLPSLTFTPDVPPTAPIWTGLAALDGLFTLGRGLAHTLFCGDRATRQRFLGELLARCTSRGTRCVLAAVGWTEEERAAVRAKVAGEGAPERLVIVATEPGDAWALQGLVGPVGVALGESLAREGGHPLVVWDDLVADALAQFELASLGGVPSVDHAPAGFVARRWALLDRSRRGFPGGGSLTTVASFGHERSSRPIWEARTGYCLHASFEVVPSSEGAGWLPEVALSGLRERAFPGPWGAAIRRYVRPLRESVLVGLAELSSRAPYAALSEEGGALTGARRALRARAVLQQREGTSREPWQLLVMVFALSEGHLDEVPHAVLRGVLERLFERASAALPNLVTGVVGRLSDAEVVALRALCVEVCRPSVQAPPEAPPRLSSVPQQLDEDDDEDEEGELEVGDDDEDDDDEGEGEGEAMPEAGMTREEFEAFLSRVAEEQPEVERQSSTQYVFWVPTEGVGVGKEGRRPVTALLRTEDDLALLMAPIDTFKGERSVATALLRRNWDSALYTRTALMGSTLYQFYACKLRFLVANEWLAAFRELQHLVELRATELGELSTLGRAPSTGHEPEPGTEN